LQDGKVLEARVLLYGEPAIWPPVPIVRPELPKQLFQLKSPMTSLRVLDQNQYDEKQ